MKTRIAAAVCATLFALSACGDSDEPTVGSEADATTPTDSAAPAEATTRLWIEPQLVDCEGVAPQKCMVVAESADGETELFYDDIEGFDFVEGTTYVIDVSVEENPDPPADGSSLTYRLVEVIEQTDAS